ncbi:MAG TPA: hypothetical protein VGQ76_15070 [Thermoanaerobaculia bacterium]|jgi:hypothetical protein|nr:hypothetical protein [Thermoanaerobaculia bacterium]
MEFTTSNAHMTPTAITLLLLGYPFLVWGLSRFGRGPMSASAIPATLTPLFLGVTGTWLALINVTQRMSRSGGGRASTAAGIAEALMTITIAGVVAAIVSAAMLLRREPTAHDSASRSVHIAAIGMLGFFAALLTVQLSLAGTIGQRIEHAPTALGVWITGAVTAAIGALVSLVWLVLSRRFASIRIHQHHRAIAASCALASLLLSWFVWHVLQTYIDIAKHG